MSTIVAVEKNSQIAVAWDSMTSFGSCRDVNRIGPPKVLRAGMSLIGVAGYTIYSNLLDHYLASSKKKPTLQDERAIFEFFLRFWRELHDRYHMVDDQFDSDDRAPFADLGAEFVVANRHGLFRIKEIMNVSCMTRFCALGSGASHAEGALTVLYDQRKTAREIATTAVEIALAFDSRSSGPVECLELADQRKRSSSKSGTRGRNMARK